MERIRDRIQEDDQLEDNASKWEWENERIMTRRIQEIRNSIDLERGVGKSPSMLSWANKQF